MGSLEGQLKRVLAFGFRFHGDVGLSLNSSDRVILLCSVIISGRRGPLTLSLLVCTSSTRPSMQVSQKEAADDGKLPRQIFNTLEVCVCVVLFCMVVFGVFPNKPGKFAAFRCVRTFYLWG